MECPHCGGEIAAGAPQALQHPCFDDRLHQIIVGDDRRQVRATPWRVLGLLRERFRRFVRPGFLAQYSARDPAEGGSIESLRVEVSRLRDNLAGSAFAIAAQYGFGYGLFPADEVEILKVHDGRRYIRASGREPAISLAEAMQDEPGCWPLAEFDQLHQAAQHGVGASRPGPRHPRKGPLLIARPRR